MEIDKILQFMKEIYQEKEDAVVMAIHAKDLDKLKPKHQSEEINELATALAKAQSELPVAKKDSENPYFKSNYADLAEIVSVSRPCLTRNLLSVTQNVITDDSGAMTLHTVLMHSSGQWTESTMRILPPKNDIQTISSYITYLKRINYAALIGVVAQDEDDDGEKAVTVTRQAFVKGTAINHNYNPREESNETVTKEQYEELDYELQGYDDVGEEIKLKLNLNSLKDLPKSKYSATVRRVREIKQAREGK